MHTIPQPPTGGTPRFDPRAFAVAAVTESLITDELLFALEERIAALEGAAAARWPRRALMTARLGRSLRRSVSPYRWVEPTFLAQRTGATTVDWLVSR